ncbi:N-acetylmuramic acid 6-phosphate etherase [Salininema proteolyticum]|uniref:N-acetylmuramic acid 6-phosphate etherase n=1 Tax=Salininema proteolyticum TaxID=1607685 RepID=A0ABV8U4V5_9ACTN
MNDRTVGSGGSEGLRRLSTEQADDRYGGLDRLSTLELVEEMNRADATVPAAVGEALPDVAAAIEAIAARLEAGGRLFYFGAGSAGRMAVMDAAECPPTFSTPPETVQAVLAGGERAMTGALEGAEDDTDAAREAVEARGIGAGDAVVGVSASGRTPFVVAALRAACERGAATVGLSCNVATPVSEAAERAIEVPVGPEVIAGSTRLKSATAQKLVLNMISTAAMVRLGRTYGTYMVDMRVLNSKLAARAVNMVSDICGVPEDEAEAALEKSGDRVKTAVVMLMFGLGPEQADARLEEAGGHLSRLLGS